jgi:hypothetical protein
MKLVNEFFVFGTLYTKSQFITGYIACSGSEIPNFSNLTQRYLKRSVLFVTNNGKCNTRRRSLRTCDVYLIFLDVSLQK